MMNGTKTAGGVALMGTLMLLTSMAGSASAIPIGYACVGTCGTSGADGDVTAPPGGTLYDWVSTDNGVLGVGLGFGSERAGSTLQSTPFLADAGDPLEFDFNFVTTDGSGFADYAWARLIDVTTNTEEALLFTARTTPGGDTVPGFGMPAPNATLTPSSTPIIADGPDPDGPDWSPLGSDSGSCWNPGCGYTGWIHSTFVIPTAGTYRLEFGAVNWTDSDFDTGLAVAGTTVAGEPIGEPPSVPEPATLALLIPGVFAALRARRGRA